MKRRIILCVCGLCALCTLLLCGCGSRSQDASGISNAKPESVTELAVSPVAAKAAPAVTAAPQTQAEPTTAVTTTEQVQPVAKLAANSEVEVRPITFAMYAKEAVNVRMGPGVDYERVGHLDKAERVIVTGVCTNGWYRIKFEDGEYFVNSKYLVDEKPVEETKATTAATSDDIPDEIVIEDEKTTVTEAVTMPTVTTSRPITILTSPPTYPTSAQTTLPEVTTSETTTTPVVTNPPATSTEETTTTVETTLPEVTTSDTTTAPEVTTSPEETKDSFEIASEFMSTVEIVPECPESYKNSSSNVGQVIKTTYYSTTVGKNRPVNILLPVNYDENKEYPVLYVLHGIYCDQNTMMDSWKTHIIISNMIADGSAEEMIVVFPYMFASKDKDACDGITLENVAAYDNFINDLVTDLMPFIESNYAAATGKDNTAVFGFSMGGREALAIGFMYPDLFGYIGADAPAPGLVPGQDWALNHPGQLTEDELSYTTEMPYLIMMGAGDSDGTVGSFPKTYHEIMERNGVTHIWYEIPGEDHNSDKAISSVTYNFCRYVFRAK